MACEITYTGKLAVARVIYSTHVMIVTCVVLIVNCMLLVAHLPAPVCVGRNNNLGSYNNCVYLCIRLELRPTGSFLQLGCTAWGKQCIWITENWQGAAGRFETTSLRADEAEILRLLYWAGPWPQVVAE